ncbi:hypothetical protein KFU94_49730 [Chloroflexi bacterium TSY]|nr:hypothetical protein [Chloroflexi bacterium TSY]
MKGFFTNSKNGRGLLAICVMLLALYFLVPLRTIMDYDVVDGWSYGFIYRILIIFLLALGFSHAIAWIYQPIRKPIIRGIEYVYFSISFVSLILIVSSNTQEHAKFAVIYHEQELAGLSIYHDEISAADSTKYEEMRNWAFNTIDALERDDLQKLEKMYELEPRPHRRWGILWWKDEVESHEEFYDELHSLHKIVYHRLQLERQGKLAEKDALDVNRVRIVYWPFLLAVAIALRLTKVTIDFIWSE